MFVCELWPQLGQFPGTGVTRWKGTLMFKVLDISWQTAFQKGYNSVTWPPERVFAPASLARNYETHLRGLICFSIISSELEYFIPTVLSILFFFFFVFLGLHPMEHTKLPRLGVESELQLPAYTTATATQDLSHIYNLHHSSWQCRIFNPPSEARDQTCNLVS